MKVALFLANGFEEMEAVSPIDILRRASIDVVTVSISDKKEVVGAHNITVLADKLFSEVDFTGFEALVLPGGMPGASNLFAHEGLKKLILSFDNEKKNIAAICAAPAVVLGGLGLLKGKEAICYPGFEEQLNGAIVSSKSVVTTENFTTGKGPGVAVDFALQLVKVLKGEKVADEVKAGLCVKD